MIEAYDREHMARERIQRTFYIWIGFGALIFGALHLAQILRQLDELNPVYGFMAIAVSVVMPSSLMLVAWLAPGSFTHAYVKLTVVLFVVVHALWVPFMTVASADQAPWLQGVNAIPAILAAVAWRHRWVWWYALAQLPLVAITGYLAVGEGWRDPILSGVLSMMFSGILVGVGLAIVAAAERQDQVADHARAQASIEASTRTREREQARINGIVRDEVMSALVVAAREERSRRVVSQAKAALDQIATISMDEETPQDYTPVGVVAALRATADEAGGAVEFWHTNTSRTPVSADVVEAIIEATSEAVRNSLIHGGDEDGMVQRLVRVTLADDSILVRVEDTGRGFNTAAVPARRLGIRVSILKRMGSLQGGDATIDSRPGRGTVVTMSWRRP